MQVHLSEDRVEILLTRWEKILGLLGNITVSRSAIGDVEVIEDPIAVVMRSGLKAGLRIPWLYYICRTIRLDQAFLVRRGIPALSFSVSDGRALKRVIISTRHAKVLAQQLQSA